MPADDQLIALPCASVIVIIVLLKLALMCATPLLMFLRSRLRMRCGSRAIWCCLSCIPEGLRLDRPGAGPRGERPYFFLPAIGFALPFRVRALVCVRGPRTGRPLRVRVV